MFSLSEHIDDSIVFDGQAYDLDMSFDNVINVQNLLLSDEDNYFKVIMSVVLMTDIEFDVLAEYDFDQVYEMFEHLLEHIGFGNSKDKSETGSTGQNKKVFDYKQDAEAIYASFFYAYSVDLIDLRGKLHYKKFKALLENLPEDATMSKIIGYRTMKVPSQKESSKEYINHVKKMKQLYRLDGGDEAYQDPDNFDYGGFNKKLKG